MENKLGRGLAVAGVVMAVLAMAASSASADLMYLTSVGASVDTFVDFWAQSTPQGSTGFLAIGSYDNRQAYMKFDLSGVVVPAGQQVAYVALSMVRAGGTTGDGPLVAYEAASDSWDGNMTWNDRVGYSSTALNQITSAYLTYFDVTAACKATMAGDGILSLVVARADGNVDWFSSLEGASGPALAIYTDVVPEPVTLAMLAAGALAIVRRRVVC